MDGWMDEWMNGWKYHLHKFRDINFFDEGFEGNQIEIECTNTKDVDR